MARRFFVKKDGTVDGECVVENPVNPFGYSIVEVDDADIPEEVGPDEMFYQQGKIQIDRGKRAKRLAKKTGKAELDTLLAKTPEECDAMVSQAHEQDLVGLLQQAFRMIRTLSATRD